MYANPPNRVVPLVAGSRTIGPGHPVFVIAEIGINHNGSMDVTRQLIEGAARSGADAVKFQKRTPEMCTPRHQWDVERDTPWGRMRYIDYRHRVELGPDEYAAIDRMCKENGIEWFASCWDVEAVGFIERFKPALYKSASASLTDHELLRAMKSTGKPLMMSTGMSTTEQIEEAVDAVGVDQLAIAHSTSAYPCAVEQLNLRCIPALQTRYPTNSIGYSGHETGLATTLAAVALGATFVERHVTLDRAMWGSDQAASVELQGLARLVRDIRSVERALGDGIKRVYESEHAPMRKLRLIGAA